MLTLSELLRERGIEEPLVLAYEAQLGTTRHTINFLLKASGLDAEVYADDFCEFVRGDKRLAATVFQVLGKKQYYIIAFYGGLFDELPPALSFFEGSTADPALAQWCANYAALRREESNIELSQWAERLRPWWNRLDIEGEEPDLCRELAYGFDNYNLAECLEKVAKPEEYKVLFPAIADNAALHYSPRTLLKYLEKQQSELARELKKLVYAPDQI